jgi:hypothetical protein
VWVSYNLLKRICGTCQITGPVTNPNRYKVGGKVNKLNKNVKKISLSGVLFSVRLFVFLYAACFCCITTAIKMLPVMKKLFFIFLLLTVANVAYGQRTTSKYLHKFEGRWQGVAHNDTLVFIFQEYSRLICRLDIGMV